MFLAMDNDLSSLRTWMEIDLSAIRHNLRVVKECSGEGTKAMLVVKANAYGLGMKAVCSLLEEEEFIAYWAVANVSEARYLMEIGTDKPIFILGPTHPGEWEEIVHNGWTSFLSSLEQLEGMLSLISNNPKTLNFHLGVNTGMGREGVQPMGALSFAKRFAELEEKQSPIVRRLNVDGIGSHMPVADEDSDFTKEQIKIFEQISRQVGELMPLKYKHIANSAGVVGWGSSCGNLVRPGLLIYGHNPMGKNSSLPIKRVMSLKSRVTLVSKLPEGEGVSYGRDYITSRPTKVATIGIGYADGYPRQLSNKGADVVIQGQRCPLLGRVTMDQIVVDVSHLDSVEEGDEVELFGDTISVEEVAKKADTIVWDIFTGLGNRVTRVYSNNDMPDPSMN